MPTIPSTTHAAAPSPADLRILAAVNRYEVLTAELVAAAAGYAPTSLTEVHRRLKRLADHGYLTRVPYTYRRNPLQYTRGGSSPVVYQLAAPGWSALKRLGIPVVPRFHATEREERQQLFLQHSLLCTQALLAFEHLCQGASGYRLGTLITQGQLNRERTYVQLATGQPRAVIPDGWVRLDRPTGDPFACFALEVDRGTAKRTRFMEKVAALLAWSEGPYQEAFGTDILQVLVFAIPGEERRDALLTWCEEVLTQRGQQRDADLFLVTHCSPETSTPEELGYGPIWSAPYSRTPQSLLARLREEDPRDV